MTDEEFDTLWAMFGYIGSNWNTSHTCNMPRPQFQQAVLWQTQRDPAYNGYYMQAIAEYQRLFREYGPEAAMTILFRENTLLNPKLPDVANYVLLQFMRWNVAFGGFRTFGYENYNGWMGGGSFLNQPPPYRALPDTRTPINHQDGECDV